MENADQCGRMKGSLVGKTGDSGACCRRLNPDLATYWLCTLGMLLICSVPQSPSENGDGGNNSIYFIELL